MEPLKRNLYDAAGGFPAGIDMSPGQIHHIGDEEIRLPDIYCEDCGQILIPTVFKNKAGQIVVKVYECEKSCHLRWELQEEVAKLKKEKP